MKKNLQEIKKKKDKKKYEKPALNLMGCHKQGKCW